MATAAVPPRAVSPPRRRDLGFSVIVVYKLAKAAVQIIAAAVLELALHLGVMERLHDLAAEARLGTSHLAFLVAHAIGTLTTARHVRILALAAALDGVLSFVEGMALHRRYWWAPWLIVVATGGALPFEIASLAREVKPVRLALFVVNLALVIYLARRALRERRAQSGQTTAAS
jgi:uncharacterized membrane protein (DUF2068 family)